MQDGSKKANVMKMKGNKMKIIIFITIKYLILMRIKCKW